MSKTKLSQLTAGAGLLALAVSLGAGAVVSAAAPPAARQQASAAAPQAEDLARGRALLEAGDVKGAARLFREATERRPEDADAWYLLGVALGRDADARGARKAFEAAAKLRPDFALAHAGLALTLLSSGRLRDAEQSAARTLELDAGAAEAHYVLAVLRLGRDDVDGALEAVEAALKSNPDFAAAHLLRTQVLLSYGTGARRPPAPPVKLSKEERKQRRAVYANRLRQAAESLERFLQLAPAPRDGELWRQQLEAIRFHAKYADVPEDSGAPRTVYIALDDDASDLQKAVIRSKPAPGVTEEARRNNISGRIRLRVVLADDGTVRHPLVQRGLPHGLTEKAISAARAIKFEPARRGGQAVSQFVTLEYGFNLY